MKFSLRLKNAIKLLLDSCLLIGYVYLMHNEQHSAVYSAYWHEWIGLAGMLVVICHLFLNRKWLIALPGIFRKANFRQFINITIVLLLALNTILTGLSGILIATSLNTASFPGLDENKIQSLTTLHRLCAHLFIPIIMLHIGLHWLCIKSTVRQVFSRSVKPDIQIQSAQNKDSGIELQNINVCKRSHIMNKLWKILITIILVVITLGVLTRAVLFGYFALNPEARSQLQVPFLHERFTSSQDADSNDNPAFERPGALLSLKARWHPLGIRSTIYGFRHPFWMLPLLIVLAGGYFLGRYVVKKDIRAEAEKGSKQP